jgi:hypothetical protein
MRPSQTRSWQSAWRWSTRCGVEGARVKGLAERLLKERIDIEAGLLRDHLRSK